MTVKSLTGCLFILSVFCPLRILGSFENAPGGARTPGMGDAGVAVFIGPEALFANPAGMIAATGPAFTFFFRKPYDLDLTHGVFSAALPTRLGCFGIGVQSFGQPLYRETTLALGWGDRIGDRLTCGAALRACRLAIRGYGAAAAVLIDAGCIVRLNAQTTCGLAIDNLTQARLGSRKEVLPQNMRMGFAFTPLENVLLAMEIDKDTCFPLRMKGGCEISPHRLLRLRCGFGSEPSVVAAGMTLTARSIVLDYAVVLHPLLGATHHISLTLALKTRQDARPAGS